MAGAIRLLGWNSKVARSKSLAGIWPRKYKYTFDHQAEGHGTVLMLSSVAEVPALPSS